MSSHQKILEILISKQSILRTSLSPEEYARHVGEDVVSQTVVMLDPGIRDIGEGVISSLRADLELIKADPLLSQQFVEGLYSELKGRRFFEVKTIE